MNNQKKTDRVVPALRKVEITPAGMPRHFDTGGRATTFVPLTIKRRHRSKLIVPPPGTPSAKITPSFDLPLIRTLGKAFYWQRLLDEGQAANMTDLARQLKLEPGWVAKVLRMTQLAPDIVQAVLEGRQPRHLNLHAVRGRPAGVPVIWQEQRGLFGFAMANSKTGSFA